MSDRDELDQIMLYNINWVDDYTGATAQAILDAGFRKTYIIETREELADLENGAVIKTIVRGMPIGRTWGKIEGQWWGLALEHPDSPILPALVIHERETE